MAHTDPAMVRAERVVEAARDFWYHFMVFVLVSGLVVYLDLSGGPNEGVFGLDFAHWVIWGWAFGVAGHAIYAFVGDHRVSKIYEREREREASNL